MTAFRYSFWDGTQDQAEINADDVLSAMADDLLNHGDLEHALRNLMQRGMRTPAGANMRGISDLMRKLREERKNRLDRYDLGGIFDDIAEKLKEVVELERQGIRDFGGDADRQSAPQGGQRGQPEQGTDAAASADQGSKPDSDDAFSRNLMRNMAGEKEEYLDQLPPDPAGRMRALKDYEFVSPEAKQKYDALVDQLRKSVSDQFFRNMQQMANRMSSGDINRMKEMMHDLNEMLARQIDGQDPGFDEFMRKHGELFGPDGPKSLEELMEMMQQQMAAAQSLMASLSPDQRDQLQQLFAEKFGDPQLEVEMMRLASRMQILNPDPSAYSFRGQTPVDLQTAMRLMGEMQGLDELARELQRLQYGAGNIDNVDVDKLRELLGDEAADSLEQMRAMRQMLEDAGVIRDTGDGHELTPRGTRLIGQRTLGEIYARLKEHSLGNHPVVRDGRLGERTDDTKPYEFGDPFHLHMTRTLRNALEREGRGSPLHLQPADFEIYRSELITRTATVLMIDLSWSMARRGAFHAAKKVALALHNLISSQFPRDSLYLVGFSAYARELKAHELTTLHWDEYMLGTNIQHALQIAERLLARHQGGTRQVIMISDGEPTSHMEDGVAQFTYPPSPRTIAETLRAVRHCTKRQITINTFMLDQSHELKEFVEALTRINGGRAFYTTPEQLGEYILVDYVSHRRKKIARGQ